MFAALDRLGRRCIGWPLVLIGLVFSLCAELLIYGGAWVCGVDPENENQSL